MASSAKHIDQFYFINIKNHKKFEGKVDGRHFALVGGNGVGKTTVIQAIRRLLAMLPDAEKPEEWITKGETDGRMEVKLGKDGEKYLVQEHHSKGQRTRIKFFRLVDDRKYELKPGQEMVRQIFGIGPDLSSLMEMSGEKQFQEIQKFLGHDFINEYEQKRQEYYKERTLINHLRLTSEAQYKFNEKNFADDYIATYQKEKSIDEVMAKEISTVPLRKKDLEIDAKINQKEKLHKNIESIKEEIKQKQQELALFEKEFKKLPDYSKEKKKINDELAHADKVNQQVREELKSVGEHNQRVSEVKNFLAKKQEAKEFENKSDQLTKQIETLDQSLRESLAKLPLGEVYPGLQLVYKPATDEKEKPVMGLFLDGLAFHSNQLSKGLLIKCVIKLSVFLNPNPDGFNLISLVDWNELDDSNKNEIVKFADEAGNVQLVVEKVSNETEIGIEFIEP